jgi:protein associated with RNAse G/E
MKYTCKKNKDIAKNDLTDKVKNEVKELREWIKNERENREELQKWIEQVSEKLDHLKT